jgi:hypothetical protein
MNRQRRLPHEPEGARVGCTLDEEPLDSILLVRARPAGDATAILRERVARIVDGRESRIVEEQRSAVLEAQLLDLANPLGLARWLALVERWNDEGRWLDELTGSASLAEPERLLNAARSLLSMGAARRFVAAEDRG